MKHKVGDKVRIKSIDWYNENKDESGFISVKGVIFNKGMSEHCGKEATITEVLSRYNVYTLSVDKNNFWYNEGMFEETPDSTSDTFQNIADTIRKIAEIIRKDNIGLHVKEQDGGILILPCKEEEGDLPIYAPVMVSDDLINWLFQRYAGNKKAFSCEGASSMYSWKYIIPFSKFDPKNIEESLKHNIVTKDLKQ